MLGFSAFRRAVVLGVAALSLGLASQAQAGLDVLSNQPVLDSGLYRYDYEGYLSGNGVTLTNGDYFTIYDFGPTSGITTPANWTFSTSLTGTTPALTTPTDDPLKLNLTWTYIGSGLGTSSSSFATFSAKSPFDGSSDLLTFSDFTSIAVRNTHTSGSQAAVFEQSAFVPVPEPTSIGLLGLGATALLARRRSR